MRILFQEYQAWLGVDLCFQGFERELDALPGCYAPPAGEIFLACAEGEVAGTVALRPLDGDLDKCCEMKRLYVREAWRGRGIGKQLAETVVACARAVGYSSMVLDTLPKLDRARGMYEKMGFSEIAGYYENPLPDVVYMKKRL